MIELLETPTFIVDDFFDSKDVRFFDYLEHEKIPFEILEAESAEVDNRDLVYYPVVLEELHDHMYLFQKVNDFIIAKAKRKELIILFIYSGHENILVKIGDTLMEQLINVGLSVNDIKIITGVKTITTQLPFIYFPFGEMEAYMEAKENEFVKSFNEETRNRIFTCNVHQDTAHARLLGASIWYHDLDADSYFNYTARDKSRAVLDSPIYSWNNHWASTGTLMDMFGQQLPKGNFINKHPNYFNDSYWNINIMDTFNIYNLSLPKSVFDPIINLQPFVLVGPPGSLKLMRSLGYETWRYQINEEYDTITDDETRMQALFRLVYELAHFPPAELDALNEKIQRSIKNNKKHLLSPKKFKLISLLNTIKA